MKNLGVLFFALLFAITYTDTSHAKSVYQTKESYISEMFENEKPAVKTIWLSAEDKQHIAEILNHSYNRLRIRYWINTSDTLWILEEVGKEKPITIGVFIRDNKIDNLKVLTYRESRGDEVRHSFFTDQFKQAQSDENDQLDKHIDGITGATLSVRALSKIARISLWLHKKVTSET